jgi:ATP-binding cassette subfamily C protein
MRTEHAHQDLLASARLFASDFARFAGSSGIHAAMLVGAGALLEGIGLALIAPLVAAVIAPQHGWFQTQTQEAFRLMGAETKMGQLAVLLAVFCTVMVVRALVLAARDIKIAKLQNGFVDWLRTAIMEDLAAARWDQMSRVRHSRITQMMVGETQRVASTGHFLLQGAVASVVLAVQCLLAALLSFRFTLFAVALLVAGGAVTFRRLRNSKDLGAHVSASSLQLLSTVSSFLGGLKLAASQGQQASFVQEFQLTQRKLFARQNHYARQQALGRAGIGAISAFLAAAVVLVGLGILHLPVTILATLLVILGRMTGPAIQIQQSVQQLAFGLPAYEHIANLRADLQNARIAQAAAGTLGLSAPASQAILFEQVSFCHQEPGIGIASGVRDLSFSIEAGHFVGVIGPSGSGKTTFADILVGLYPPQTGKVTIGGTLLTGDVLDAWRKCISYVPQDSYLFHESIRRNLAWARPDASEDDLWLALEIAGAVGIVQNLPQGLDTVVGERGALLSGGERQRIAIARALLRNPILLVLDEATNAIDMEGERLLFGRLVALSPRLTIVLITHRSASVSMCDDVISFQDGRGERLAGNSAYEPENSPVPLA